jgi:hypothetical protein
MSSLANKVATADIQRRCHELAEIEEKRESAKVFQLPLWPEPKRGTPNSFLRSALFSAILSKDRAYLEGTTLFSQQGITVKYTGKQLNQEDLTLWEILVHLARQHPLGYQCSFSAHSILKGMGLPRGGEQHKQLHNAIMRLNACSVEISHEGNTYFGSLIEGGVKNELSSFYTIELNKKMIRLFGDSQWTGVDWQQRLKLRRKALAQSLHGYYSSHKIPKPVTLQFLQNLTGSRNSQPASFKRQCRSALEALTKIGFLESYSIEGGLVTVKRAVPALGKGA